MKRILLVIASVGAIVIGSSGQVMAAAPPPAITCTGGDFATGNFVHIGSGTYASVTVAGACDVEPGANISIVGNLTVAAGGVFDAQTVPSTITVGHNVTAAAGSLLGLGCQPDFVDRTGHECGSLFDPDEATFPDPDYPCVVEEVNAFSCSSSSITVDGNITATGADTVLLNGITVKGNVTLTGGGGDIPWSLKNNTVGGNLTVSGVTADWLGVLFNQIGKNATLTNITATDPGDPGRLVFVVRNTIGRNLTCIGLAPGVSGGFNPFEVDIVGRHAIGQCAPLIYPRVP